MKKFLNIFFVVLGIIFFIQICVLSYIWFADPFNIRPMIEMLTAPTPNALDTTGATPSSGTIDKNPALSPTQESALESIGINPANLPTTITPEMESCFTNGLSVEVIKDVGHFPHLENSSQFNQLVVNYLTESINKKYE